ncbi:unnamed protein product [Durusdinium trenchii]
MPELAVLAMAVKCWAKRQEVGSVLDGGLSSYAWTLLIVYYLQVCHGLPSLHKGSTIPTEKCWVYWERRVNKKGKERKPRRRIFDLNFKLTSRRSNHSESLGAWFQGFFDFYANDFDWKEEVVSVRCGRRLQVEDPSFAALKVDRAKDLQIEDPVEISRNLNFALTKAGRIPTLIQRAAKVLRNGHLQTLLEPGTKAKQRAPLEWPEVKEILRKSRLSWPSLKTIPQQTARRLSGRSGTTGPARYGCVHCFQWFSDLKQLEEHQSSSEHLGTLEPLTVQDLQEPETQEHVEEPLALLDENEELDEEGPPEEAAVSMRRTELRNKQAKLQAQKATLEEEVRKLELQLQELQGEDPRNLLEAEKMVSPAVEPKKLREVCGGFQALEMLGDVSRQKKQMHEDVGEKPWRCWENCSVNLAIWPSGPYQLLQFAEPTNRGRPPSRTFRSAAQATTEPRDTP